MATALHACVIAPLLNCNWSSVTLLSNIAVAATLLPLAPS
ncbi:hypothetical protein D554_1925 [Bordetella holmesii 30539]|uniref:Uncharacterized protein n=2 Tax=Bordetella holmesii TaxID=35814 RepID=A0A158M8L0_9BORD|nr:hypothetical protein D560_0789 [Bordetella holmesii ATCC 51541]AIT25461.1 hypothetical protein D558_0776 [Bordetella holmesii 44057]EWM46025.1 hypothetical protein D557_4037 [Bordetella holmesii 70147]EWM48435.1 hypothetical protein D556_0783 [Bordetella holmesii 41130]EXF86676.1 hypothetical protein D554_1925 [Bordetella holmesii 30539]EXX95298.1 hypothetical protein D559_2729 [Bordetella holmesii 1058]KAK82431.1 hypothetical protein L503_2467 [Bordetella holmesii CDC-H809-BH]KAK86121.1 